MSRLKLMTIYAVNNLIEAGNTRDSVAHQLGISRSAVDRAISGKTGSKQRQIADRMEYFLGGATKDSGCYCTNLGGRRVEMTDYSDPTFDTVAFLEEYEE